MRQIIGAFGILFILLANIFVCTGLIGASGQVAAAKEYKPILDLREKGIESIRK